VSITLSPAVEGQRRTGSGMPRQKAKYKSALPLVTAVLVAFVGCSKQATESRTEPRQQVETVRPAAPKASEAELSKFTPLEIQVHDFFQTVADGYGTKVGIEKGEALALIATSKEFGKPIVEAARIYDSVEGTKTGSHLTDAETDALNMRRFRDIGFQQINGVWSYDGQAVNMGAPLPTPESMKPKQPVKELEVAVEADVVVSELRTLRVRGKTNLPDETEIMIHLSCPGLNYSAEDQAMVMNGKFESSSFSDARRPLQRLGSGQYLLELSTPTASALREAAANILGEKGRNMTGRLIKFDEVFGNRMNYSKMVDVR
jgi:hypothetical protein